GDCAYIPRGCGHSIQNIGSDDAEIVGVLDSGIYRESTLSDWLAKAPRHLLANNFGIPEKAVANFGRKRMVISASNGAAQPRALSGARSSAATNFMHRYRPDFARSDRAALIWRICHDPKASRLSSRRRVCRRHDVSRSGGGPDRHLAARGQFDA